VKKIARCRKREDDVLAYFATSDDLQKNFVTAKNLVSEVIPQQVDLQKLKAKVQFLTHKL
jgi:hypothetical protein